MDSSLAIAGLDPVLSFFLELALALITLPVVPPIVAMAISVTGCGFSLLFVLAFIVDSLYRLVLVDPLDGLVEGALAFFGGATAVVMCGSDSQDMLGMMKDWEMLVAEGPSQLVKRLSQY